ncbi:MAG TPA: lytic polysaccharide monooxygenase [Micromonosporaceae bacterium]|nr:lytic polysaccharide monooxygenase [Micromonosporaceae bacterium]
MSARRVTRPTVSLAGRVPALRRTSAAILALGLGVGLGVGFGAVPAGAHGATLNPVSRADACGPEGGASVQSAACQAAATANGGKPIIDFDNIRVANVDGKDRERIPDGKLCSAGIDRFKGLDLPRTDWPSTQVTSGAAYTFRYRATITHTGTFRFYVTKDGYQATEPLRWDAMQTQPFASFTDPTAKNGVYAMPGKLPTGKTGRHVIYVIWQNTGSPDTYYSCSDVLFAAAPGAAGGAAGGGGGAAAAPARPGGGGTTPAPGTSANPSNQPSSAQQSPGSPATSSPQPQVGEDPTAGAGLNNRLRLTAGSVPGGAAGLAAGGGLLLVLLLGAIFAVVSLRRRRHSHAGRHTIRK